jgi:peptidoglycan hydrolase CwlO-like protein
MKKNILILTIITAIVLLIINISVFSPSGNDFQHQIDSLNKANDSLFSVIDINKKQISQIDSVNKILEKQVEDSKFKLGELNGKANIYKKLYNEEHNRIDTMSNPILIREFTNAFD